MNLDFLEIGTCDYDTEIEACSDSAIGISIEPVKYYLDKLPTKPNVIKINGAISLDGTKGEIDVFYVPPNLVESNNLEWYIRGCNSVGKYHDYHISKNITHLVVKERVPLIPIADLFDQYSITSINLLKIDTEGADCRILNQLWDYLDGKPSTQYPEKVIFETNLHTSEEEILKTVERSCGLGYTSQRLDMNTILTKREVRE